MTQGFNAGDYPEWCAQLCAACGWTQPTQIEMVAAWAANFRAYGYSVAEANEAAGWVLFGSPPESTGYQSIRAALVKRVLDRRRAAKAAQQEQRKREADAERPAACNLCRGS